MPGRSRYGATAGSTQSAHIRTSTHGARPSTIMAPHARCAGPPLVINNDILRRIRYMLDLGDVHLVELARLADARVVIDREQMRAWLLREDDADFEECPDRVLAHVLDGLVVHLRGRDKNVPARPVDARVNNNVVLKKLRVAFQLRDVDLNRIFADAGHAISKPELTAFFRQPGHANYRACGDQVLRNFLKGLTLRVRGP